jgi:hemerythrin-like domain-containing protein
MFSVVTSFFAASRRTQTFAWLAARRGAGLKPLFAGQRVEFAVFAPAQRCASPGGIDSGCKSDIRPVNFQKEGAQMEATDVLMSEHRVIERVIAALETAAFRLESGEAVSPEFFTGAADFIKGFADGCHHVKEENVLFKAMAAHGVPVDGGPIGVMLSEHEAGRQYTRAMRAGAEGMKAGEPEARPQVIRAARAYTALLRQHIAKEDDILFPMANRVIPAAEHAGVWDRFETVEHEETGEGVHEKYLALAGWLEGQITPA